MDTAAAERRAEIWLQDLWAGRDSAAFALPPSRLALEPGDVVALSAGGRRRLVELRDVTDGRDRRIDARSIDPEVFALPLAAPRRPAPVTPSAEGPVHALTLDLPSAGEGEPVLTRAAVFAAPWPGPVAMWCSTDGASFSRAGLALAPSVMGATRDDLPRGPAGRWHMGAVVRVELFGGVLASVSDAAFFAGANMAALRPPDGAWEVIQFAHAQLVAARTYVLSRLLRGQGGSEWAQGDPLPAGAPFVLLDDHLVTVAQGVEAVGVALSLRFAAAARGHGGPNAAAVAVTPGPVALKPLSPVHLRGRRTAAGVELTWIRRTRTGGDAWEVTEVPLGEEREAYEVDVMAGASVKRTLVASSATVLYAAADELADFGAPQSALTIRVAQLSASVGRGNPTQATLGL
jgi:hypothetical protein